jgi:nucleoside-diphosphate kinase
MLERTFAIIKPNATERRLTGAIISRIEEEGFRVVGLKQTVLTKAQAEGFYAEHSERPFFSSLVTFMTSGPVVLMVLEADNAIKHWREVMGATNPEAADEGTIRKIFGESVERNATHGSDSETSAQRETAYFFNCFETV